MGRKRLPNYSRGIRQQLAKVGGVQLTPHAPCSSQAEALRQVQGTARPPQGKPALHPPCCPNPCPPQLSKAGGWAQKHRILLGEGHEVEGVYGDLLARSKFCLVLPGEQQRSMLGAAAPCPRATPGGAEPTGCQAGAWLDPDWHASPEPSRLPAS